MTHTYYPRHPLSAAFPDMSQEDRVLLRDSLEANGQRDPIMIYEGMVLDGWHRQSALKELDLAVKKFTFDGTPDEAIAFVIDVNARRRHLTPTQLAAAIAQAYEWMPAGRPVNSAPGATLPKKPTWTAAPGPSAKTTEELAQMAGVSKRTMTQVKTGVKAGLADALKSGALSAKQAEKIVMQAKEESNPEPKPTKPPKPDAHAPAAPTDLELAHDALDTLRDELHAAQDRIAAESMEATEEDKLRAAATMAELRAQVKELERDKVALLASERRLMRDNEELKTSVRSLQARLAKQN